MKRWIQKTDSRWATVECCEDADEVFLHEDLDLLECLGATCVVVSEDHLTNGVYAVAFEEHVLCAGQADAFSTELDGLLNLLRGIGVGADPEGSQLVSPAHEFHELLVSRGALCSGFVLNETLDHLGRRGLDTALVDVSNESVEGKLVAFLQSHAVSVKSLLSVIDGHSVCTTNANLTHLTGNESSV